MQKLILILPFLLVGCAAGIDHKIAYVGDTPYLVQTPNRQVLRLFQWAEPPVLTDLTQVQKQEIDTSKDNKNRESIPTCEQLNAEQIKAEGRALVSEVVSQCHLPNTIGNNSRNINYRKHYECVVKKLAQDND